MESILTAVLSITILIVGVVTTFSATNHSAGELTSSVRALSLQAQERLATQLDIKQVTVDSDGGGLTLDVRNSGQAMITAFNRVDVIVEYFDAKGAKVLRSLAYQASSPGLDEWVVWGIQDDRFNPRLLDPGETMVLVLKLSDPIGPAQAGRVTVVAPNGVFAVTIFTRS